MPDHFLGYVVQYMYKYGSYANADMGGYGDAHLLRMYDLLDVSCHEVACGDVCRVA